MGGTRDKKVQYFAKLKELLTEYKSIFVVGVDNVSSQQMHETRKALRGEATVLMGKNTMVRRAIRGFLAELPEYGKTSFFQALGVPTKIARGFIEIVSDVKVVEAGNKVGPSEASLLNLLGISPFTYGLTVSQVYDNGQVFPAEILDITDEELVGHFVSAIQTIASVSLAVNYPTLPSVGHSVINHYKNVLAVSIATDYTFEGSEAIKDRLANPEAYAAAAPAAEAGASEAAAEEAAPEDEESEDDDMGFGLFD